MRAVLASRNAHKARELEQLLPGWTIEPLDAVGWPAETGATYYENALAKARFGRDAGDPGRWTIGEDSGIEVRALDGRPGVHSARFAPVALAPDGREVRGSGILQGRIADAPSGVEGFGYDPVFVPDGEDSTVAQLGDAWKAEHSHRARAARALRDAVERIGPR